jgi:GntR family transcriptional regulator
VPTNRTNRTEGQLDIESKAEQIAGQIKGDIIGEKYPPRSKLPSMEQLGGNYDVSYSTMQEVMRNLRENGWVKEYPGRGTYVAYKADPPLDANTPPESEAEQRGS